MDLHLALFMITFDNPIEFRTKFFFGCYAFVKSMNGFINVSIESLVKNWNISLRAEAPTKRKLFFFQYFKNGYLVKFFFSDFKKKKNH